MTSAPLSWIFIYVVCGVQDVLTVSILSTNHALVMCIKTKNRCFHCLKVFIFFNHLTIIVYWIHNTQLPEIPKQHEKLRRIFLKACVQAVLDNMPLSELVISSYFTCFQSFLDLKEIFFFHFVQNTVLSQSAKGVLFTLSLHEVFLISQRFTLQLSCFFLLLFLFACFYAIQMFTGKFHQQ